MPDPPPGIEKNRPVHVHGHPSCVWTSWVEVAEAAAGWDVELPKGVFHATEWIAAGFPACVDGGSAPLGGEGPQQFRTRHLGDNESRLSSPGWRVVLTFRRQSRLVTGSFDAEDGF